jgi:hypothetical protein
MFWRKRNGTYIVTLHLNGRHPYLSTHDLDMPTRDIDVTVKARDWNDAQWQAFRAAPNGEYWSCHVKAIRRLETVHQDSTR